MSPLPSHPIPSSRKRLARWSFLYLLLTALTPEALAQQAGDTSLGDPAALNFKSPSDATSWNVRVSVNGGHSHSVQVDTGSLGLALPLARIGKDPVPSQEGLPQPVPPSCIRYSSSGVALVGTWVMAKVDFLNGPASTGPMPVLGVDVTCHPKKSKSQQPESAGSSSYPTAEARKSCPQIQPDDVCSKFTWEGGMMGVGFNRGAPGTSPQYNALRQLAATRARANPRVREGYIISSGGITVGLTDDNTRSFNWVPLAPAASSTKQWPDWQALSGCFSLKLDKGVWQSSPGTVLVDTGLTNMYLSAPETEWPFKGPLPAGALVTVTSPCGKDTQPVLSQVFSNTDGKQVEDKTVLSPSRMTRLVADVPFVNTGSHLLQRWDYAYDAQNGRVGFKLAKNQ